MKIYVFEVDADNQGAYETMMTDGSALRAAAFDSERKSDKKAYDQASILFEPSAMMSKKELIEEEFPDEEPIEEEVVEAEPVEEIPPATPPKTTKDISKDLMKRL